MNIKTLFLSLVPQAWSDFKNNFLSMCMGAIVYTVITFVLLLPWDCISDLVHPYYHYILIRLLKSLVAAAAYVTVMQGLVSVVYRIPFARKESMRFLLYALMFDTLCYFFKKHQADPAYIFLDRQYSFENYQVKYAQIFFGNQRFFTYCIPALFFNFNAVSNAMLHFIADGINFLLRDPLTIVVVLSSFVLSIITIVIMYRLWFVDIYLLVQQASFVKSFDTSWYAAMDNFMNYGLCFSIAYAVKMLYLFVYKNLNIQLYNGFDIYISGFFYSLLHIFFLLVLVHVSKERMHELASLEENDSFINR